MTSHSQKRQRPNVAKSIIRWDHARRRGFPHENLPCKTLTDASNFAVTLEDLVNANHEIAQSILVGFDASGQFLVGYQFIYEYTTEQPVLQFDLWQVIVTRSQVDSVILAARMEVPALSHSERSVVIQQTRDESLFVISFARTLETKSSKTARIVLIPSPIANIARSKSDPRSQTTGASNTVPEHCQSIVLEFEFHDSDVQRYGIDVGTKRRNLAVCNGMPFAIVNHCSNVVNHMNHCETFIVIVHGGYIQISLCSALQKVENNGTWQPCSDLKMGDSFSLCQKKLTVDTHLTRGSRLKTQAIASKNGVIEIDVDVLLGKTLATRGISFKDVMDYRVATIGSKVSVPHTIYFCMVAHTQAAKEFKGVAIVFTVTWLQRAKVKVIQVLQSNAKKSLGVTTARLRRKIGAELGIGENQSLKWDCSNHLSAPSLQSIKNHMYCFEIVHNE